METYLNYPIPKNIYNYSNRFMVSWWGTNSYFNNKPIKIGDTEMMNYAYVSSGSFGLRLR